MMKPLTLKFFYKKNNETIDYGVFQFDMVIGDFTQKIASMPKYLTDNIKREMLFFKRFNQPRASSKR